MKSVILAAGSGRRMLSVTDKPKCMLKVGEESLIRRQIRLLRGVCSPPLVVVGYRYMDVVEHVGWGIDFVMNPVWKQSNTLISLLFAIPGAPTDCLVINGDVVFREDLLPMMLEVGHSSCAVQDIEPTDEEVKVVLDDTRVMEIGKHLACSETEAVGVYLFRKPLVKAIRDYSCHPVNPWQLYYEDVLNMSLHEHFMEAVATTDAVEIDTPEDYERAKEIYT